MDQRQQMVGDVLVTDPEEAFADYAGSVAQPLEYALAVVNLTKRAIQQALENASPRRRWPVPPLT